MRPGSHHSPEVRARISRSVRRAMASPEVRRKISERTKAAMADPAVRAKISNRTKRGMAKACTPDRELADLTHAWNAARPSVRQSFLAQFMVRIGELQIP